ncbi:MAG TPA: diacylglycerol kinase family protein [Casimicrobiaceae bacterium]|nr:diacylglycerol kinase family protein [Casimicrobiaceae bacterium]
MSARLPVIVNASAGSQRADDVASDLAARFSAAGLDAEIRVTEPAQIGPEVRRAARDKPPILVVAGGDGTLNAAAPLLIGGETALGIVPLGTLNHFAKDLAIPLDLDGAIRTIADGRTTRVDLGMVNDRFFLNNSSLGLYPRVVAGRNDLQQRLGRRKLPALLWAGLAVFRRYPFLNVRIDIEGSEFVRKTPFVFVGNNRYQMEGFRIGERLRLDNAVLSLYVANRTGRLGLIRLAIRALFKRLEQSKDFDAASASSFVVETRHDRLRIANDGELCMLETPLLYRVLPAALLVVVPSQDRAAAGA